MTKERPPLYQQVVVDHLKVGKLGEGRVRWQGTFHTELDLPGIGLEPVSNVQPDSLHHHIDEMFELQWRWIELFRDNVHEHTTVSIQNIHSYFLTLESKSTLLSTMST